MSDFTGKWESENESGALLLRSANLDNGTIYYGACTDKLDDAFTDLSAVLDEIDTRLSEDDWELENFKQVADEVVKKHATESSDSTPILLYGALDIEDEGIVGVYWKNAADQPGDFAFLPQDENRFVAALTTEPTLTEDGWWLRQGIHPTDHFDDDDDDDVEFDNGQVDVDF